MMIVWCRGMTRIAGAGKTVFEYEITLAMGQERVKTVSLGAAGAIARQRVINYRQPETKTPF